MLLDFKKLLNDFHIKPRGVIHIGAWDGAECETYLDCGINSVIFIEAQKEPFNTLRDRISRYPYMKAYHYCVSDKIERVIFHVASNSQSGSILEPQFHLKIHPEIAFPETIEMDTTTVEKIFEKHKLNTSGYDMVVMDIQGAELKVIKGLGHIINYVEAMYLEVNKVPVYRGCCLVGELDEYLDKFGFKRVVTGNWVKDAWTDSLYVKQKS